MALTETQSAALRALADAPVYTGNGFSLPTMRRLERDGLATVRTVLTARTTSRQRTAIDLDWSAQITEAGYAAAKAGA